MSGVPLLTLVVPVYNAAAFLPDCFDGLAAQTLARHDFEIVAVDDGSTDRSGELLAGYARRLPNLRVVRQENGGLSAARNAGLRLASAPWVAFLDADDFVAPDTYARWLEAARSHALDMVLGNGWYHREGREPDRPILSGVEATGTIPGAEWLRARLEARFLPHMVWLHLYRREFLVRHRFAFVPRLAHEDVLWTTRALLRAGRVRFCPEPLYYYRLPVRRPGAEERARRLDATIASSVYNARQLAAMVGKEVADPGLARLIGWQLVDGAMSVQHKIEQHPDPAARRAYYRRLREEGFYALLWRHAFDADQRRRIAGRWMRALVRSFTS